MALSHKARKRWSLVVLLIGLPAYILVALNLVIWIAPQSGWVELLVYVGLGIIWIVPLRQLFLGVGQEDPDEREP